MNVSKKIKEDTIKLIENYSPIKIEVVEKTLGTPPQTNMGDLYSNICFPISKKLGVSVNKIAEDIVSKIYIPESSLIVKVEARNGYINFYFNYEKIAELTLRIIHSEKDTYGRSLLGKGKKAIVEFPSVNPGKPWHIGHGRNAIIGDTIQRVLKFSGFEVEVQNYIDDLGLQVAQILWGILNFTKEEIPEKKYLLRKEDQWQGRLYIKVANLFEEKEEVETKVRNLMKKMEFGDYKIRKKLHYIVEKCLKAQYQTAFRLGIEQDLKVHESDILSSKLYEEAYKTITKNEKIVKEESGPNAGCLVAKLEEYPEFKGMKSPDKILVRSDGTATYTGKDLAYQMWKFGLIKGYMKFKKWTIQPSKKELWTTSDEGVKKENFGNANIVINIIGFEQKYPQRVLSYILKLMGYEDLFKNSIHLAHEHIWLKEEETKKISGRAGTWVGYTVDEILNEAAVRANIEVNKRNPDLPENEKKSIAEKIGVSALRYSILNTSYDKVVLFDYDKALSFEGDTGPYLQYAHTRIHGILRKAGKWKLLFKSSNLSEYEKILIKIITKFPDIIEETTNDLRPKLLCSYSFDLANAFDRFYENCPVLKTESEELTRFRLTLIDAVRITLKNALDILGIEAIRKM